MKTTARGILLNLTSEQQQALEDLMNRYNTAIRWSFKRLLDNFEIQHIRLNVQQKFGLNSRQANDAVYEAQQVIVSQIKLVNINHKNAVNKVEQTQKILTKAKSPKRIQNLTLKLEKQQRKLAKLQKFVDTKTFPNVVFGTKKLFIKRCKGLITKEEWQQARNNRYVSRGDKSKGGNLNTRLYGVDGRICLDIATTPVIAENSVRYHRITVPVYLAQKLSKKTGKINGHNYQQMVLDYLKTGQAYQVEIIREKGRYYVHVTLEEEAAKTYTPNNGLYGIDTNPNGLGVTHVDYLGQFKGHLWMSQGEWTYARTNRRDNLIGEQSTLLVKMAKESHKGLAVEDLDFKEDRDVSVKFNRMSHGFVWSKFLEAVERKAAREGVPLIKVKPAFTSVIGILKYQEQYGISNHEAAAYVIGRRALGFNHEKVPRKLVNKFVKNKDTFPYISNWKQWALIKRTIAKRKEVKSLVSWQHNRKKLTA
ncbi:MAG: IS200/IS605 family accessory protein TnpB-related protein [Desulfitobacteriaceae bacterium]